VRSVDKALKKIGRKLSVCFGQHVEIRQTPGCNSIEYELLRSTTGMIVGVGQLRHGDVLPAQRAISMMITARENATSYFADTHAARHVISEVLERSTRVLLPSD
jgi:hypothetical protein